jgi:hypothetical protein
MRFILDNDDGGGIVQNCVIPAQAGIQLIDNFPRSGTTSRFCPLRGMFVLAGFRPTPE